MKKAAGYIRVSKFDGDGISPENQRQKIEMQAQLLGVELVEIYSDLDLSGKSTENRPDFQRLMSDVQKYDLIIVYKLNRFTRSVLDFHDSLRTLDKYNVYLYSVSESFDTSSPVGRLLRNIIIDFAQFEREANAEQVRDNMMANASEGNWNGGNVPYGYKLADKQLIPDEDKVEVISFIFIRMNEGAGANAIRNELFQKGIPSPSGKMYWHKNTIRAMVRNPLYLGKLQYGGMVHKGKHDPIVGIEEFRAAVSNLEERSRKPSRVAASEHLLSGLIRCPVCGRRLNIHYNGRTGYKVRRYMCPGRNDGVQACKAPILDADGLERVVVEKIFEIANYPDLYQKVIDLAASRQQNKATDHTFQKKVIQKRMEVIKKAMVELFRDYYESGEDKRIPRAQFEMVNGNYLDEEKSLDKQLQEIEAREAAAARAIMDIYALSQAILAFRDNWEHVSPMGKKELARGVISWIEIDEAAGCLRALIYSDMQVEISPVEVRRGAWLFKGKEG